MESKSSLKKFINVLIHEGGSDLHLSAGSSPTIRVAGSLVSLAKEAKLTGEHTLALLGEMISKEELDLFLEEKEIDFSYQLEDGHRFRGNAFFQRGEAGIAMRLIPSEIRTISELGLPPILESFARRTQGFFLVVGPVGQGKTTTLAALVDLINKERSEHIVTIEDPIEYIFEPKMSLIDQREVKIDTKDFQHALRGAFRQDIDVLLIGEMRGPETMAAAVTAAETGHLVFSTLHTNNAA
ncbi:type IV pili twitching motility protein PilT, partial [Candidatus Kaiserbacteria bacterium]